MVSSTRKDEVMSSLLDGIEQLTSSQRWQDWLTMQSRFHNYSFGNTLLIMMQRPDATRVAGFHSWRKLGRNVRKGEKAIWILAPVTRKATDDSDAVADDDKSRVLVAFKPAAVFDVAQTDGEEMAEVCTRLDGDDANAVYGRLLSVAHSLDYTVEDADLGECNGDCTYALRRIRVATDRSPVQRVKTLAHEIAHAMLHEHVTDRPLCELEAESIAYVVCAALGINSGGYTFGYVASWAGGGDEAIGAIKASGGRIQRTADDILQRFEVDPVSAVA